MTRCGGGVVVGEVVLVLVVLVVVVEGVRARSACGREGLPCG